MRKLFFALIVCLSSCSSNKYTKSEMETVKIDLEKIFEIDQFCARNANPPENFKNLSMTEWTTYKDSVYKTNRKKAEYYLDKYGYLGIDKVGEKGSNVFWVIAQHSDKDVAFQKKVLKKLKIEVDRKNANPRNYAYLYDRVKLNNKEKQLYATQVEYNKYGQAIPKKLEDSINIDSRRLKYNLEPLKEYLNEMTKMHFEMNKELFLKRGITEPKLYK